VNLLRKELEDATRRFEAGTVPRFNVLRAEVEVANARPKLIRAKNTHRITRIIWPTSWATMCRPMFGRKSLATHGQTGSRTVRIDLPAAVARPWSGGRTGVLRKAERCARRNPYGKGRVQTESGTLRRLWRAQSEFS